jgi:uncharacterized membrane protein YeaQ/YmgE (transglycosylase-associated protein family)
VGIFSWIIIGLLAGVLAKFLLPGNDRAGWIVTILLGIVGALLGGYLSGLLGYGGVTGINLWSILVATVGAVIVLAIYHLVTRR